MWCETCRGFGHWWEWWDAGTKRRSFAVRRPAGVPASAVYRVCLDCIGGIASCCDAAGS